MRLTQPSTANTQTPVRSGDQGADEDLFQRLKFRTYDATLEAMEDRRISVERASAASLRDATAKALELVLAVEGVSLSFTQRTRLIEDVSHEISGYGPIQPLLNDPSVDDIIVNGFRNVYAERAGELHEVNCRFRDDSHLMNVIQRIVGPIGRRIDEASPYVDARLPDGSRVNAIIPPIALDGPMLSIRKFREKPMKPKDLVRTDTLNLDMMTFLADAVHSRLNVLICGGTGSGKTTLLNAMSSFIGPKERVVTIEDAAELRLQQRHVVRLETRPQSTDSLAAEVTARDLVRNALRMRPDRIVLGEVRGPEAIDMLQAMGTGHDGSMATIHANSPREAMDRLEILVAFGEMRADARTLRRFIANSIHLIVQVRRMRGGKRRVVAISELTGIENDAYSLNDLYTYGSPSPGAPEQFVNVSRRPHFEAKLSRFEGAWS